ncbi:MAG: RNA polymerase sigma factor RpoE [Gammaproteobacteria bacterium]|nr:RNA polymerase sigma factor RpoE [Gammaproteobacteria bacterium]
MSDTDQALVARAQHGDQRAFELLVTRYQHKILKLVSRYVRDRDDAMDVAQDTFIKAYKALKRFRGDSAFYTWLYRVAINTAKNYLTANARRPLEVDRVDVDGESVDIEELQKNLETPEKLLLVDEMRRTIFGTIDELPDDLRTAIMLREIDGLSYEEIAVAMDCPIGTVRSRIFRAREGIDIKLKPLLEN